MTEELLSRWCDPDARSAPRALVFCPHPDDEVIGLGGQLPARAARTQVVYVSDGAPENPVFFAQAGFATRRDYALARKQEARRALAIAGIREESVHELGLFDQAVTRELTRLPRALAELTARLSPEVVFAPPYEGGHPDHDATALAVHAALALLRRERARAPALLEYTSYHVEEDALVFGRFLPDAGRPARAIALDRPAREIKRRMLACHATQQMVWRHVELSLERVRVAPAYDFRAPPRAPFHYDRVDWGARGAEFLARARGALDELGLEGAC